MDNGHGQCEVRGKVEHWVGAYARTACLLLGDPNEMRVQQRGRALHIRRVEEQRSWIDECTSGGEGELYISGISMARSYNISNLKNPSCNHFLFTN